MSLDSSKTEAPVSKFGVGGHGADLTVWDGARAWASRYGGSSRAAAWCLTTMGPESWPREIVDRYLTDLVEERGTAARVSSVENARLLNDTPTRGPGLAACEACRAVFTVQRRHPTLDGRPEGSRWDTRCPACVRERDREIASHLRRPAQAWWSGRDEGRACIGCSFRGAGPNGADTGIIPGPRLDAESGRVVGQLYCSDACRKLVKRHLETGGRIEIPMPGSPTGTIVLGEQP